MFGIFTAHYLLTIRLGSEMRLRTCRFNQIEFLDATRVTHSIGDITKARSSFLACVGTWIFLSAIAMWRS